ncbi:PAS domain S-box protein [Halovenus rubra]|uniref:histidine kinase n=2 Tax=Halovenus rubra TaxID=869890 RepID=A0ABD5X082_9EURY|nr:PAS domain S-box protein [Halovenus rubra]
MSDRIVILGVGFGTDGAPTWEGLAVTNTVTTWDVSSVEEAISGLTGNKPEAVDCLVVAPEQLTGTLTANIERLQENWPDVPILVTNVAGPTARDALAAGATDVIDCDREAAPTILANRVQNAVKQQSRDTETISPPNADSDYFSCRHDQLIDSLLEWSSDRMSILDRDGTYKFVSPAVEHLMGYDPGDLLGTSGFEHIHPEDREAVKDVFEEVINCPDQIHSFEYRVQDADGEWMWVESRGTNRFDDPNISGVVITSRKITKRKEREQQLREERKRLNILFDRFPEPTVEFEFEDGVPVAKRVNSAFEETFGYDSDELLGESVDEYIVPQPKNQQAATFNQKLKSGDEFVADEVVRQTADGKRYFLLQTAVYNDGTEGFAVYVDINDQKERQQQLREEKALSDTIFNTLPDIFFLFDEHGQFIRWNDRANEVSGYTDEEIASMHPSEFVVEDDRQEVFEGIANIIEHDETVQFEARARQKDGDPIPYEYTGTKLTDETGNLLGIVGLGRDISGRKERQRRFEAVFNNTYQFTGLMKPDGTVIEINETALQFGGLERNEVVGKRLWDTHLFQNSEKNTSVVKTAVEQAQTGSPFREELEVQGAERTEIIDFSVRPIVDEQGEVTLLVPEGRTITALKERERHLKIINRFLRHNLRNKMTVIKGTTDVLFDEIASTGPLEYLKQIDKAAVELIELAETAHELLQLTIEADTQLRPMNPSDTLSHVVSKFRTEFPEASITLSVETDSLVSADHRLEPVFEQLIENAIIHADHDNPSVTVSVTENNGAVLGRIVDNGPGIPPDELSGIVTDEEQTQLTHGTGFGLWLVRAIVDDYNGTLSHEYVSNGGSAVTVQLPTATDASSR